LCIVLTVFVMVSVATLLLMAVSRWVGVFGGLVPVRSDTIDLKGNRDASESEHS